MNSKKQIARIIFMFFVLVAISACEATQATLSTQIPETIAVTTVISLTTPPPTATQTAEPSPTPSKTPSPTTTPTQTPSPTATPLASDFSNLILALDYNPGSSTPLSPRDYFPVGVSYIAAIFDYNVPGWTELEWAITNEKQKTEASGIAGLNTGEGKKAFVMLPEKGLDEGTYELTLKLDDEIVLSRPFEVFWAPTLWPVSIGAIASQTGEVEKVNNEIPFGSEFLFASFPTINFSVGDEISATWFVNGKQLGTHQYVWDNSEWSTGTHTNKIDNQRDNGALLPVGNYELFVSVNGTPTQCKAFVIFDATATSTDATPTGTTSAEVLPSELSDRCQAVQDSANPAPSADTWRRYQPRTFAEVEALTAELLDTTEEEKVIYLENSPSYQYPSRIRVKYTGEFRDTSGFNLEWIKAWAYNNMPSLSGEEVEALFAQEVLVTEGSIEYWLPVQSSLIPIMEEKLTPGDYTEVLVVWMGAVIESGEIDRIYLVNAFWE